MPTLIMRAIRKSLLMLCAMAFVLTYTHSVIAQQWPVGQTPVENAVPQYRPNSVPQNSPTIQPDALPLNFFGDDGSSVVPEVEPPVAQRPVIEPLRPQQPMVQEPSALRPTLSQPIELQHSFRKPKTVQTVNRKPVEKATTKEKQKAKQQPVLNNEIYRDQSLYPIDPRKPNWPCGGGNCKQGCQCKSCLALGNGGRPYHEKALGGCKCDSCKPNKHPNFSVHWPRPFSAKLDAHHPEAAAARYAACQPKRIVDIFDGLSTFKLSGYKRTDNGYCGPGADPYGCVGESKMR